MKNFIIILVLIILMGCNDDNVYIPFYQDAIYIMDADGSNKQKVIDVDGCSNVQFLPNSDKLLYMLNRTDGTNTGSLYTVNTNGSEITQISGELKIKRDLPSISDDGSKIIFWAFDDSRDYTYDLHMVDPMGIEITNLTQTEDVSEKEATFINYQNLEYLLYVTYFNENEINYSTISMMNTTTFEIDTLYVEEIEEEWGFKHPLYYPNYEILFVVSGQVGTTASSYLYSYDSLINGNPTLIPTEVYGYKMEISLDFHKLIFQSHDITIYDIIQNEVNFLVDGYWFDPFNDKVIYSSGRHLADSDIYSIKFDGSNNKMLTEDGIYPRFSDDGSQIVFIGKYVTNPRRNLITN